MSRPVLIVAAALLIVRCTHVPVAGGGASETIASVAPHADGCRIAASGGAFSVRALLYDGSFSPEPRDSGRFHDSVLLTESDSEWIVTALPESTFNIIVFNTTNNKAALFIFDNAADSRSLPQMKTLTLTAELSGVVSQASSDGTVAPAAGCTIFLRGTPFTALSDRDGMYRIVQIPEGAYALGIFRGTTRWGNSAVKQIVDITSNAHIVKNLNLPTNQ